MFYGLDAVQGPIQQDSMFGHIIIIAANATCIFTPKFKNVILYKEMIRDIQAKLSSTKWGYNSYIMENQKEKRNFERNKGVLGQV